MVKRVSDSGDAESVRITRPAAIPPRAQAPGGGRTRRGLPAERAGTCRRGARGGAPETGASTHDSGQTPGTFEDQGQ